MCGIGLVVAGVRIDLSSILHANSSPRPTQPEQYLEYADWRIGTPFGVSFLLKFSWTKTPPSTSSTLAIPLFSLDDLKAALWRRGPDSLGSKKVFLRSKISSSAEGHDILSLAKGEEAINSDLQFCSNSCYCSSSVSEEPCKVDDGLDRSKCIAELHFIGATLQLRGVTPINQPLVDTSGNILVYNGEIFGGIHVSSDSNDAEVLMEYLAKCCSSSPQEHIRTCSSGNEQNSVLALLSTIKGPWALIYWQASSRTVWFGRDAFGRRSLLVHWPTSMDSRLLLSSVAPPHSINKSSDLGEEFGMSELNFWEELPCGVYSIQLGAAKLDANVFGEVKRHEWTDPMLNELIKFERSSVQPKPEVLNGSERLLQTSKELPAQAFLITLREAVIARSKLNLTFKAEKCDNKQKGDAPMAVLFSGGLDSMILAALLDECLDPKYEIDLLNVSFDNESAPDRISARAGVKELKRISPLRRWKLVEIDADLSNLTSETKHVMSLINPAKTYMDLNIGLALWLAATGDGCVYDEGIYSNNADNYNNQDYRRVKYKSEARILLVGSGADEQCAGYGRHKTKYRNGSWIGLHEEMKLDMQRIWKRNLGRDDRCIGDNGKEARFPFLDEHVIRSLLDIPLWEIVDLDQPSGKGDKKILREVARLLGLHEAAVLPKRAIQFGSRIARESNRKNFGSNRAANQASAGSVDIYQQPN